MSESKYPTPFAAEWWEMRNAIVAQIAESQRRQGVKWTREQIEQSKRSEYVALYGREPDADERYAANL